MITNYLLGCVRFMSVNIRSVPRHELLLHCLICDLLVQLELQGLRCHLLLVR